MFYNLKYLLWTRIWTNWVNFCFIGYSTFFIVGLILSMQIPFVGFQPIKTSEHMASAGELSFFVWYHSGGYNCKLKCKVMSAL